MRMTARVVLVVLVSLALIGFGSALNGGGIGF